MLRIVFTPKDLRRVRVAAAPHPTWELILSINSLQRRELPARLRGWRDTVTATHDGDDRLAAATTLVPASGNFPDFLTPATAAADVAAHYEAILSVPRQEMRRDLQRTFREWAAPPRWARTLYRDGRTDGLVRALRDYQRVAVEPVWPSVRWQVARERDRCAGLLLDGGVDGLLSNLHPSIRWRAPALEATYPVDRTIALAGRGLTIVPAHFCWDAPVTFIHTDNEPMLVCPAGDRTALAPEAVDDHVERLAALVGRSRARLLARLDAAPATTSELAGKLAVSPAAVSQHTKVMREAGLLTTSRLGQAVQHALTPFGQHLLHSGGQ